MFPDSSLRAGNSQTEAACCNYLHIPNLTLEISTATVNPGVADLPFIWGFAVTRPINYVWSGRRDTYGGISFWVHFVFTVLLRLFRVGTQGRQSSGQVGDSSQSARGSHPRILARAGRLDASVVLKNTTYVKNGSPTPLCHMPQATSLQADASH